MSKGNFVTPDLLMLAFWPVLYQLAREGYLEFKHYDGIGRRIYEMLDPAVSALESPIGEMKGSDSEKLMSFVEEALQTQNVFEQLLQTGSAVENVEKGASGTVLPFLSKLIDD